MMSNWIKYIVAVVLAFYALDGAIKYGGIWHSQAYPTPGVEVTFSDGAKVAGAVSQAWSGDWVLASEQGTEVHFRNFRGMSVKPSDLPEDAWFAWRKLLPSAMLLSACLIGLACWGGFSSKTPGNTREMAERAP